MDYKTAFTAMQGYFNTSWDNETLVIWGDDDNSEIPDIIPWVRFNVRHASGFQATAGSPSNNRFERLGIVTIQIFTRQGNLQISSRDLADKALKIYEGVYNSGILYFDATVREIGQDGRGWHQVNVLTSFRYSEIT